MRRHWIIPAAVGLLGVVLSAYLDRIFFFEAPPAVSSLAGGACAFLYFLSTLVLAPYYTLTERSRRLPSEIAAGRVTVWPWWSWLVLAPLFVGDGRAKVPGPISAALLILLHWLVAWTVFIVCMVTLSHWLPPRHDHALGESTGGGRIASAR